MTYEGARSATGPFMLALGASAGAVGVVAGLGELAGYAVRLASGYMADRLRRYWLLTGIGYAINLLAVPLLALAGRWEVAAGLIVVERIGKAIRTPSRDVMLSYATHQVGRGFGFGLHEALDQVGAVTGPLLVAGALFAGEGYARGFAVLLIPALLALGTLAAARVIFPAPAQFERAPGEAPGPTSGWAPRAGQESVRPEAKLSATFWLYVAFSVLSVAGFAHFQLISYHLKAHGLMADAVIPVAFAVAMGVDALTALAAGRLYDRSGMASLLSAPLLTIPAVVLAFGPSAATAWTGVVLWGAAMGVQETIMRAAIADLAPAAVRGAAYGVFNTAFGVAWFAGSAAMGFLYDLSPAYLIGFALLLELASIVPLAAMQRQAAARA
ncbi:MAG: MFS transporter [Limnochordaceae bacterium]|nr:MFS transporter [Limnochordaceae bacterium]